MGDAGLETEQLRLAVETATDQAWVQLTDVKSGFTWPRTALVNAHIYDRATQRIERVTEFGTITLEQKPDCIGVTLAKRSMGIHVRLELRLLDGEFSVRMNPAEISEAKSVLYRLFNIDLLPGMMRVDRSGELLLPVNTGVICKTVTAPAANDKFLIYGEQDRWELLPTLPVCAVQSLTGGLIALATGAPAETECQVSTDGRGNGSVGFGFFLRGTDVDPVEPARREIRYSPIAPGANLLQSTASRVRRHVIEDLGKTTLAQRRKECPEVDTLLKCYIMKLFFGMQMQGTIMADRSDSKESDFLVTMTFDEASTGLGQLKDAGVEKIYTQNVGWNWLGHDGLYPTRFPIEPRVGGEDGFRKFIAHGHSLGFQMTVHDNYIDGYASSPDFDADVVTVDKYQQHQLRGFWGGGPSYLMWPLAFQRKHLEDQMLKVKEYGIRGPYYLDGMGSPLYLNYHPKHRGSRSDLARGIDRLLKAARSIYNSSAVETGFLYCSITPDLVAHPGGEHLMHLAKKDWPITPLLDRCVPLWQMVMSGLVLTENQNLTWKSTMQALLYAQTPRWEWATRPGIHKVLDAPTIKMIKARYDLLIKKYGHLRLQQMTNWTRDGETETTTFEDGTVVTADFEKLRLTVNGEIIQRPAALTD